MCGGGARFRLVLAQNDVKCDKLKCELNSMVSEEIWNTVDRISKSEVGKTFEIVKGRN